MRCSERDVEFLPLPLKDYVNRHTKKGSAMRRELICLLMTILSGVKVKYSDIKGKSVKYHVDKMRRLGLLVTIRGNDTSYLSVNPEILLGEIAMVLSRASPKPALAYGFISRNIEFSRS